MKGRSLKVVFVLAMMLAAGVVCEVGLEEAQESMLETTVAKLPEFAAEVSGKGSVTV